MLLTPLIGRYPRLQLLWADTAYQGPCAEGMQEALGVQVAIVKHRWGVWVAPGQSPPERPKGFVLLPHRWIVERTFAWFLTNRRLVVDFDAVVTSSEARLYLCMIRIMLRRLTKT